MAQVVVEVPLHIAFHSSPQIYIDLRDDQKIAKMRGIPRIRGQFHSLSGLLDALHSILDYFGPPIFAKRPPKRHPFCDKMNTNLHFDTMSLQHYWSYHLEFGLKFCAMIGLCQTSDIIILFTHAYFDYFEIWSGLKTCF